MCLSFDWLNDRPNYSLVHIISPRTQDHQAEFDWSGEEHTSIH